MHLEFAPLEFVHNFGLVVVIPVFSSIVFEINWESWVDQSAGKLFGCQSLEAFFHELVDDGTIRLVAVSHNDVLTSNSFFLLL